MIIDKENLPKLEPIGEKMYTLLQKKYTKFLNKSNNNNVYTKKADIKKYYR